MGGYVATPLSIKKYIKIPPRRLISGFLHINVISHDNNDDKKDAYQWYRDEIVSHTSAGTLSNIVDWHSANPWQAQAASVFDDEGRDNKFLSFGDYDCLLFWVAGGFTIQAPLYTGSPASSSYLSSNGYADTTAGAWYTGIDDYCQNFIKYDLISRINNGYGHAALMGDELYKGTIAVTKNEFRSDEAGWSGHDSTVAPPNYSATGGTNPNTHGGNFQKHITSCGSHSTSATTGDGDIDLSTANKNTFFPPVQDVKVYGTHRLNIVSQTGTTPAGATELYSHSAAGGFHLTNFWNLVIDIQLRGFDDGWTSGSPSQADMEWFKSRVNVFFQPFGETGNLDISDTEHTS
tara:strand:+ start:649 stop:1692 length:1044 start_codon:yes stop_codon:yes gene_type:complete